MRCRHGRAFAAVLLLSSVILLSSASVPARTNESAATPDVATLLFDTSMWRDAPTGAVLRYGYTKRTAQPALGLSFDDDIVLTLGQGSDKDSRTADVTMFSGRNTRAAGPFFSSKVNPVMALIFEQNVQELAGLTKTDPLHLKNAIRKAWRDDAKISAALVDVGGRRMAGTRISVQPFVHDPDRGRMLGLDTMVYAVEIADALPGTIAKVDIRALVDGRSLFSETLRFKSETTRR